MHILVFTAYYLPGFKGGGPIRTVANMIDQLGDDVDFSLCTSDRDLGDKLPYASILPGRWQRVGKAEVLYLSRNLRFISTLWSTIATFKGNALNLNSFFSLRFSILPLIFWRIIFQNKPIIIGPRGEFSSGALNLKPLKKKIFILFAKLSGLYGNIIWHASTDHEKKDILRIIGANANIKVAVDIAKPCDDISLTSRSKIKPLKVVFISRISPMKNLLGAIEILQKVRKHVVFDVYGPIEDKSYFAACEQAGKLLQKNVKFNYCGSLPPDDVVKTLAQYDLFFLPTLGENFGHVIAEALAAGLPVLISDATPWRDLRMKSIGSELPLSKPDKFVEYIEECSSRSPTEYDSWRKSIRAWALANIGNKEAIEQNKRLFMELN